MTSAGTIFILFVLLLTLHMGLDLVVPSTVARLLEYLEPKIKRLRLYKPPVLPLRMWGSNEIIYTEADWRRDNRREHFFRYYLTCVLGPKNR